MKEGNRIEVKKTGSCPVHRVFQGVHEQAENKGVKFIRINLREALQMSLKTKAYVDGFIEYFVPEYKSLDQGGQAKAEKYVLIADLLKRGLWNDLKSQLITYSDKQLQLDLNHVSKEIYGSRTESKNDWEEKVETLNILVLNQMSVTLKNWVEKFEKMQVKDEMYKQRYDELYLVVKKFAEPDGTVSTVNTTIGSGLRTSIEYPMGMLKSIPKLLEKKGVPVTVQEIKRVFFANLLKISSTVAAQNLVTFTAVNSALNKDTLLTKPSDFSQKHFILDTEDNIVLNPEGVKAMDKAHSEIDLMRLKMGGSFEEPHLTCPALFSNILIEDYEKFFEPIFETLAKNQNEYR